MNIIDAISKLDIVGILQVGIMGLAFLMALLSAVLLLALIGGRTRNAELFKLRSRTVIIFMVINVGLCILVGGMQVLRDAMNPKVEMPVMISPAHVPDYLVPPTVLIDGKQLTFSGGYAKTDVGKTDQLEVSVEDLVERARSQNATLVEMLRVVAATQPNAKRGP